MKVLDFSGFVRRDKQPTDVPKQILVTESVRVKVGTAMVMYGHLTKEDVIIQMLIRGFEIVKEYQDNHKANYPFENLVHVDTKNAPVYRIPNEINEAAKEWAKVNDHASGLEKMLRKKKSATPIINRLIEIGCDATPTKTV